MPNSWNFGKPEASHAQLQRAARLHQEARELGALADIDSTRVFTSLLQTPWDDALMQFCEFRLEEYRARAANNPDCLRPHPGQGFGLDQGDIPLGVIAETGLEWRLPLANLPHVLIAGPTGGGKTNLAYVLVSGVSGRIPVLYITLKDDTTRLAYLSGLAQQAFVFDELQMPIFVAPNGVDPVAWRHSVIETICRAWGLQLSRSLLHRGGDTLAALYEDYSRRTGRPASFTPAALLAWLSRTKTKYTDAPVAVLENLCRVTGNVFEWSRGCPVESLFTNSTILSLASIVDDQVARFVVDVIIDAAYRWLTVHGPNDRSVQLVIFLDDGHRFVSRHHEKEALTSLSSKMLIIHQSGIRIITISQYPSDLAPATLSQSGIIIQAGGLVHQHDLQAVGAAFGMAPHECNRLQQVGTGGFIVRENLGRYPRPFAGMIHRFPDFPAPYCDATRRSHMAPILAQWHSVPAIPLSVVEASASAPQHTPARVPGPGLTREALALVLDVLAHPYDFLNIRYSRLNLAGRIAQKAKEDLVNRGYVREHSIPRRGRPPILLEPLPPVCTLLNQQAPRWGKGGFVHAFMIRTVMHHLAGSGHRSIQAEKYYGSKAVDIVAETPAGDLVGFECAHSLGNVVDNLLKDFMAQPRFSAITTVCLSQADLRQALHAIDNAPGLQPHRARLSVVALAQCL